MWHCALRIQCCHSRGNCDVGGRCGSDLILGPENFHMPWVQEKKKKDNSIFCLSHCDSTFSRQTSQVYLDFLSFQPT